MMRSPSLTELPAPASPAAGWPFTEAARRQTGAGLPRVSVVIPSFNQGRHIEMAIRSVLLQGYPDLELIVMDGGSTDDTVEIIRRYERWIAAWVSAPDRGQSHAINEGFRRASGEICAWIGCDDWLEAGALVRAGAHFADHPGCRWLAGSGRLVFPGANRSGVMHSRVESLDTLLAFWLFGGSCFVVQPSCFWRRSLWDDAGGLREDLHLAMDYDLWLRFAERTRLHPIDDVLSTALREAGGKTFDSMYAQRREIMRCAYAFAVAQRRSEAALTAGLLRWYVTEHLRRCRGHVADGNGRAVLHGVRRCLAAPIRLQDERGRLELLLH
jgi:glycosyltransferase involved in cell wall biosynthesis